MKDISDRDKIERDSVELNHIRRGQLDDIKAVLQIPEGRRFIWRLLEEAKVFGSVFAQGELIHYQTGQQDFGHFIMREIESASPMSFVEMYAEEVKKQLKEREAKNVRK